MSKKGSSYSLRRRLLLRMTAGFAVLLILIAALLWSYARGAANRTYDLLLAGAALSILETVSSTDQGIIVDLPHSALDILSLAPRDRVFYSVTANGVPLTGQGDLPPPGEPSAEPRFFDLALDGTLVRSVAQSRRIATAAGRSWVTVQVAQTVEARTRHAVSLFLLGLGGLAFVSMIGLGFVWLAVRTALQPLARIQMDLDDRDPADLNRLDIEPPVEVAGLVGAINGFMRRLDQARRQSEAFMADVAHQTRTGLAALQGHLSMAADAEDPAVIRRRLRRAEDQAARTTRLTNQLLSHAMVIHRAENQALAAVDLRALLRDLLSEMLRDTVFRRINVAFDDSAASHPAMIRGDQISLREAFRNVVENAVRHGPTDNSITIRLLDAGDGALAVEIEDEGPGLPPEQRTAAVERFQSLNADSSGSGLGLAIVKEVARAHSGTLTLAEGGKGGLLVRMVFPAQRPRRTKGGLVPLVAGLLLLAWPQPAGAGPGELDIWSATDRAFMRPVIEDFQARNPDVAIDYREFETVDLHAAFLDPAEGLPDVVISSAMDLAVDLVNRGHARAVTLGPDAWVRPWSAWRSELFGFTFEPAAVVYNRDAFAPGDLPKTHAEMAVFIRDNEERLRGRIGGYDIRRSGAGYLLATQEARLSPQFFRVAEAFGRAGGRVFCCSSEMIDRTATGELLLGLNVIGSYALAAAQEAPGPGVHFFDDFNPVMLRSAFVPAAADDPGLGTRFVKYLLSDAGQRAIAERSGLLPIDPEFLGSSPARSVPSLTQDTGRFVPIRLSVGLLTHLDGMKRAAFLKGWEAAVQSADRPD